MVKSTFFSLEITWIICHCVWTTVPPSPATTSLLSRCFLDPRWHFYFSFNFPNNKVVFYTSDSTPRDNNDKLHRQNAQEKKQANQEEKRVKKETECKYFLDPSKLKLEKPQCFAKYHIQLLVFKKNDGGALSGAQRGNKSTGWPGEPHPRPWGAGLSDMAERYHENLLIPNISHLSQDIRRLFGVLSSVWLVRYTLTQMLSPDWVSERQIRRWLWDEGKKERL